LLPSVRPIPLVDVKAQYEPLLPRIREAIDGVLASGEFILGPNVVAFEREAADYIGVREGIGVANGTDALVVVMDALGIGAGDEVICPAFTFYATAEAIARRGATPVFADVDAATMNLDPEDVAARVTPRTKAIIAVHLFGRPAPTRELTGLDVPVIEDAAQAFGSPEIGSDGIASTFSFYPTKNLFCIGDGGLVTTDDGELADRVRMLRFHGSRDKVDFELLGYNSRLDELQAAVLRVFLGGLDGWIALRREAAGRYAELGLGAACELPEDEQGHAYHLFVCRSPERDRIRSALGDAGIGSAVYYATPLHLQPALTYLGYAQGSLPVTEQLARENFSVPLWAGIDAGAQERVVSVVQAAAPVAS
jgi:dTDP-3-amino-3,4,6-trideoxy-alpha-D-glucose transaminase